MTATAYVKALLARADEVQCLNAIQEINDTQVLAEAAAVDAKKAADQDTSPLCGLPLGIKDSLDVAGYHTSAGNRALAAFKASSSAPLIDQWKAANGIVFAKTRLHELSAGGTSINAYYGAVLNPYNNTRHVGGSSGGSGVLVSTGVVPAALCEDTGGSCRMPAAANGVVGFRPTINCYNASDGLVPATYTRDTPGMMARSVSDLVLLDSVVRVPAAKATGMYAKCLAPIENVTLAGTRIGFATNYLEDLDASVVSTAYAAIRTLEAAGAIVIPINITSVLNLAAATNELRFFEGPRELARWLYVHDYGINIKDVYNAIALDTVGGSRATSLANLKIPLTATEDGQDWINYIANLRPKYLQAWADIYTTNNISALIYPTYRTTIQPINAVEPNIPINGTWGLGSSSHTTAESQATQSIVSIPVGVSTDGMPVDMQFLHSPGSDGALLSLALAVEPLFAGAVTRPPAIPECAGCTHFVGLNNVTYTISSQPAPGLTGPAVAQPKGNDTTSFYSLTFKGNCSAFLQGYGQPAANSAAFAYNVPIGRVSMQNADGARSPATGMSAVMASSATATSG
ncbi:hypothetical protein WJX72_005397 [[Myrmecia] bisecta]|uniref:Amidase domain-containing protein n=1 Tax=[Myrmecia] bisecta TaxID=41462 RepID=A0AAW1R6L3_9CHLO